MKGQRNPKAQVQNCVAFTRSDGSTAVVWNELEPLDQFDVMTKAVADGDVITFTIVTMERHVMADEVNHSE